MVVEAIYSDDTNHYLDLNTPGKATIRIRRSSRDQAAVFLCCKNKEQFMINNKIKGPFSWYFATIDIDTEPFDYYFKIISGNDTIYYDRKGASNSLRNEYLFRVNPTFSTPDWAKGAVMYQILVDRFANGDDSNNVLDNEYYYINVYSRHINDWDEPPKDFDVANFYGGDLQGVKSKLGYLKKLGVEVIYFNPIFVSPSNHKYDSQDYDYIDPHIGVIKNDGGEVLKSTDKDNTHATKYIRRTTDMENLKASNEFFAELVKEAHEMGIKVIIDGVFNHCGSFNKWLDREGIYKEQSGYEKGAFWAKDSPYRDFFGFTTESWPKNESYEGWWNHNTLPKLNYEMSQRLREFILNIAKKWVSPPYNADGWRLDVAADLGHSEGYNHSFWKDFRKAVKEANPEAIILAEHYGDASSFLQGDEWDTVMNYDAFMEPVSYFLTGMEKHSDSYDASAQGDGIRFEETMKSTMARFMSPSMLCAMNQLSNHDHSRFMTRTNKKVGRVSDLGSAAAGEGINKGLFRAAVTMQMTLPGAPTLYYGDEAGVVGFTDPDSRRTYPWGKEDGALIDFHRDIIYIHKHSTALRKGSFLFLTSGQGYTSYARFDDWECYVMAFNSTKENITLHVPVWYAEISDGRKLKRIMYTDEAGYSLMPMEYNVVGGYANIDLAPCSSIICKSID